MRSRPAAGGGRWVEVDPERLSRWVAGFAERQGEFPRPDRPLALKNLKLVAFVQNDETREVLTAVQIDLEGK